MTLFSLTTSYHVDFDFQIHKIHLKSFVFEILLIGDNSSTFDLLDGKIRSA